MRLFPAAYLLAHLLACAFVHAQGDVRQTLRFAVFSPDQTFWPSLAGADGSSKAKHKAGTAKSAGEKDIPLHIAVLPIRIKEADWKERIPCDSCHRLSPNGLEFFLENYLAQRLSTRFREERPGIARSPDKSGPTVELAAPHFPLFKTAGVELLDYQDSLSLPWKRWFDGYSQDLIYRPKDFMTPVAACKRLDRLGGLLGATHLLVPAKVWMKLDPRSRTVHEGSMEWGFQLLFWNVSTGRPEWALAFTEVARNVDLDAPLDERLDKSLVRAWDRMPQALADLWNSEPR
jgi:hypothetical protein